MFQRKCMLEENQEKISLCLRERKDVIILARYGVGSSCTITIMQHDMT
ncbi:MAG TPA: hypothetical protein VFF30_19750 [Nitrososphaerales archaeon]|nr:hypothetical protein [Nitrososphaerales archaeon]